MNQLNAEGVPPPSVVKGRRRKSLRWRGRQPEWTVGVISSIVHNENYKGRHPQHRWTEVPRDAAVRRAKGLKSTRKTEQRPRDEWVWTEVPAIVDEATWEDANRQLEHNTKHLHRPPLRYDAGEVMLYGGHVRCAACTSAMTAARRSPKAPWYYKCYGHGRTTDGKRCPGVQIPAAEVDARVWAEAQRLIRDTAYLRSLLDQTDEVWSPDTQIAHYDSLIAECDAKDKEIGDELMLYLGSLAGIRARLTAEAEANAAKRAQWERKRADAVADKERRTQREQRLQQFITKAAAQAPTLDDLTPDQRRTIVLDLHPDVRIGRVDDRRHERVWILFELSADTAARAFAPGEVFPQSSWTDKAGNQYWSGAYKGWPPTELPTDANGEEYVDFSDVPDDATITPYLDVSIRPTEATLDTTGGPVVRSGQPPATPPAGEYPVKHPTNSTSA